MKQALKIIGLGLKLSLLVLVVSILYVATHQDSHIMSGVAVASISSIVVLSPTCLICRLIYLFK